MSDFATDVQSGDTRKALEALRDLLATEIEGAETQQVAGLSRQLLDVLVEIKRLPATETVRSPLDELDDRRRRATATR